MNFSTSCTNKNNNKELRFKKVARFYGSQQKMENEAGGVNHYI